MTLAMSRISLAALVASAATGALAADADLVGCWRSQQIQLTYPDQRRIDENGNCVMEYDGTHAHSRCRSSAGESAKVLTYDVPTPGVMRATMVDQSTGTPASAPYEVHYRIDGDWLLIDRAFPPAAPASASAQARPARMESVSVRVPPRAGSPADCKPHADSAVRIGRTPVSSLTLSTPPGWEPWLVDPAKDARLGHVVDKSLFIGAFVPAGTAGSKREPAQLVLVVDDVRPGPVPVRAREFAGVKKQFFAELGAANVLCDQPDRACGKIRNDKGLQIYGELFNIDGRVVMVTSTTTPPQGQPLEASRDAVRLFVKQLAQDNGR